MFCYQCGSKLVDGAIYCTNCGMKVKIPENNTNNVPSSNTQPTTTPTPVTPSQKPSSVSLGTLSNQTVESSNSSTISDAAKDYRFYYAQSVDKGFAAHKSPDYSNIRPRTQITSTMKWHNFLIYFYLWVGFIGNLIAGIVYMCGGHYISVNSYTGELENYSDSVYYYYENLQTIDIIYGIGVICTGIIFLAARSALANYKEIAPKLLTMAFTCVLIDNLLYLFLVSQIIGIEILNSGAFIAQIIISALIILLNHLYYKNRDYMFYN